MWMPEVNLRCLNSVLSLLFETGCLTKSGGYKLSCPVFFRDLAVSSLSGSTCHSHHVLRSRSHTPDFLGACCQSEIRYVYHWSTPQPLQDEFKLHCVNICIYILVNGSPMACIPLQCVSQTFICKQIGSCCINVKMVEHLEGGSTSLAMKGVQFIGVQFLEGRGFPDTLSVQYFSIVPEAIAVLTGWNIPEMTTNQSFKQTKLLSALVVI